MKTSHERIKTYIVSPSSSGVGIGHSDINLAIAQMHDYGLDASVDDSVFNSDALGLAGSVKNRTDSVTNALLSPTQDLIMSFWGGYNTNSITPHVVDQVHNKTEEIKPAVGYSDFSSLLLALYAKGHNNIHHGPSLVSFTQSGSLARYAALSLTLALSGREFDYTPYSEHDRPMVIQEGAHTGTAIASNLDTLTSALGTPYVPEFDNAVLFIEEAEYIQPRSFFRNMSHLSNAGVLQKIGAICLGTFCDESGIRNDTLSEIISELPVKDIPIVSELAFGHAGPQMTIPYGRQVTIDTSTDAMIRFGARI